MKVATVTVNSDTNKMYTVFPSYRPAINL